MTAKTIIFQSTPSSRKVTKHTAPNSKEREISIHTFLAEGDFHPEKAELGDYEFQSTPSSRKVTSNKYILCAPWHISIHTFLAEGDGFTSWNIRSVINFNPHLPRGRWHKRKEDNENENYFNPHLPRGRWHATQKAEIRFTIISIHTFLAEGDIRQWADMRHGIISIHTFLAEGDLPFVSHVTVISVISIHTFLAEGDHLLRRCNTYVSIFQSTPSSRKVTASFLDLAFKPAKFQSTPSSRKVTTAMHWW